MRESRYLSKEYTNCLRGLFSILVVIHHLYQYSGVFKGTILGEILQLSGVLSVAVFFFFSGYGLMFSANKKDYIENFFRNRFLPLYCFYIVLIIIYSLWTLLIETTVSPQRIVQSFFFGKTIVTNGWYMQVTFVLYLLYWLIFRVFKSPKVQIFSFGMATLVYFVSCFLCGVEIWWYQTVFCMIFGMVYCYKKDKIDAVLAKYVWIILVLSSVLFSIFAILSSRSALTSVIYSLFFVCVVLSLSYILCDTPIINNAFFSMCGKYSLEIYVTHGLFLKLLRLNIIKNKLLYMVVVILGTVLMSVIMKIVYKKIVTLISVSKKANSTN